MTAITAAEIAVCENLCVEGGNSARKQQERLIMNVLQTNEIRELTATELDAVSGGMAATDVGFFVVVADSPP